MRRAPHDEMPLQAILHVSPAQPPVQTSGHLVGMLVVPVGQPGGAVSGLVTTSGSAVSGLLPSTPGASVPSLVSAVEASSPPPEPSAVELPESVAGTSSKAELSAPPHPSARKKKAKSPIRMRRSMPRDEGSAQTPAKLACRRWS